MAGNRAKSVRAGEPAPAVAMVGYVRVSTEEQGRSGLGLEAQRSAIEEAARRRGWQLVAIERDVASGRSRERRPGLDRALERCGAGEAAGVVVAKLDRLSRSLLHFAELVEQSRREQWNLVALDQDLDLETPSGRAMAGVLAVFAQWEREMVSLRTCQALEAARARGIRLGRPPLVSTETLWLVRNLRRREFSFAHVADLLNAREIPAPMGGLWNAAAARRVYLRAEALGPALRKPAVVPPPRPAHRRYVVRRRVASDSR